jgi:dihydrodipicolinate synthase/N-acetylneuraminate lyase
MKIEKLFGPIPATYTPMQPDGHLNLDLIDDYYALLVRNQIHAIFICGTTGEGELLTMEERKLVAEKWLSVSQNNKAFKVIVVVGSIEYMNQLSWRNMPVTMGAMAFHISRLTITNHLLLLNLSRVVKKLQLLFLIFLSIIIIYQFLPM